MIGMLELGTLEQQVGPLRRGREVVAREGIDVGGGAERGGAFGGRRA
jgi:hypothetical protein